jgi:hypothetical protein
MTGRLGAGAGAVGAPRASGPGWFGVNAGPWKVRVTLNVIETLKVTRILGGAIEGRLNHDIRG